MEMKQARGRSVERSPGHASPRTIVAPARTPWLSDLHVPSPCLERACEHGAVCVVKNDEPVCECPEVCPQTVDPVCSSSGLTYNSPCEMRAMGCALQRNILIQHKGPC
ncbi:hypothetical protein CRUP_014981, partial [Coryphaenoides rupestris]